MIRDQVLAGKRVVILGGGVSGLAAAFELSRLGARDIKLVERRQEVGGLAGTVKRQNVRLDLGSHRIHPNYEPYAFALIQRLLGEELLERPRLGRIFVNGRFLGYPPTPIEIFTAFGLWNTALFAVDYALQSVRRFFAGDDMSSFEGFLTRRVGGSLYRAFYRPYAIKLWNADPTGISFEAGKNRAKKFEMGALISGLQALASGRKPEKKYFYPAGGIGQIAEKLAAEVRPTTDVLYGAVIEKIENPSGSGITAIEVRMPDGSRSRLPADVVVSTIPIRALHDLVSIPGEAAPPPFELKMRSLRILYVFIDDEISEGSETIYIPSPKFRIGRVSQISRYSPELNRMEKGTVLALEMICSEGDETWTMPDEKLTEVAVDELRRLKIIGPKSYPHDTFSTSVKNLYPQYSHGWKEAFDRVYSRLDAIENLYMIGRPALFLHCNIDHCMTMAHSLADHLSSGATSKEPWRKIVPTFFSFQVKD